MIDAHVHFWNFDPIREAWITPEMEVIRKDFLPPDWKNASHFEAPLGCIAVQADQSATETLFLTQLADQHEEILGVVGWVDLTASNLEAQLKHYQQFPKIKGFRHIAQAESDDFFTQPEIIQGIATLHHYGFTYDILVYHTQLPAVLELVKKLPKTQKLIIDHAAKPAISTQNIELWASQMQQLAAHANVYCKVSGLCTEAIHNQWHTTDFFPYLKVIFDAFGADRVVFGSDWPVLNLSADFLAWVDVLRQFLITYDLPHPQGFWANNAATFYNV